MPNWAANQLIVKGEPSSLSEFSEAAAGTTIQGERTPLSLEALLPTPAHLLADADANADGWCVLLVVDDQCSDLADGDWCDWRGEHWGVKWELEEPAELIQKPGMLTFWFDTAWTGPVALVAAMAQRFPALSFELVYADHSMSHAGIAAFEKGECRQHEEAYMDESSALEVLGRHWPEEAKQWLETIELDQDESSAESVEPVHVPGDWSADALREAPHHVRAPATQDLWSRRITSKPQ